MKERILVVDDQHDVANALVRLLDAMGYEAKAIYDGRHAVDVAKDFLPDMAFIDIGMPGFDGYQTVSKVRAHRECAHAILVAFTGHADREAKHRAYKAGFDLHVPKPVNIDMLKDVLSLLNPQASNQSTATRIFRMAAEWSKSKGA